MRAVTRHSVEKVAVADLTCKLDADSGALPKCVRWAVQTLHEMHSAPTPAQIWSPGRNRVKKCVRDQAQCARRYPRVLGSNGVYSRTGLFFVLSRSRTRRLFLRSSAVFSLADQVSTPSVSIKKVPLEPAAFSSSYSPKWQIENYPIRHGALS